MWPMAVEELEEVGLREQALPAAASGSPEAASCGTLRHPRQAATPPTSRIRAASGANTEAIPT